MSLDGFYSIIEHQKKQIKRLLNFEKDDTQMFTKEEKECLIWKILVLDKNCGPIFNTILKKGDIRKCNVIKSYSLWEKRAQMPHICAIYIIDPNNDESFMQLYNDFSKDLYDVMAISFIQPIKPDVIAMLAGEAIKYNVQNKIYCINQSYLQYRALSNNAMTLDIANAYTQMKSGSKVYIDEVSSKLYCFLRSHNYKPYIIYLNQDIVAEEIAKSLINTMKGDTYESDDISERIVLYLLSREYDVHSMLHHSWYYIPLIHDLIGIHENSITLEKDGKPTQLDLDFYKDELVKEFELKECGDAKKEIDKRYTSCMAEYSIIQNKTKSQQETSEMGSVLKDFSDITTKKAQ